MIIWGWGGGKPTDFGPVVPIKCPNCHNQTALHYVKTTKWFRLYFIPLVPYSTEHFLLCPVCTRGTQLDRMQAQHASAMVMTTSGYLTQRITAEKYATAVDEFYSAVALPADLGHADATSAAYKLGSRLATKRKPPAIEHSPQELALYPTRATCRLGHRRAPILKSTALTPPTRLAGEKRFLT